MKKGPLINQARGQFHQVLLDGILSIDGRGMPNVADKDSNASVTIAQGMVGRMGGALKQAKEAGQTSGKKFEEAVADFLRATFLKLGILRPGDWIIRDRRSGPALEISDFEQYEHLATLMEMIEADPEVAAALGADYLITPDVVILRRPEPEERLNRPVPLVDAIQGRLTPLRQINRAIVRKTPKDGRIERNTLLLHASVSCKWNLRSDRAQNARSEALNLIRNRKGRVPHIVAITAEPLPSRIASLALGTSDLDCVYHIALLELSEAVNEFAKASRSDQHKDLATLVNGKRLRDISDLPLDLTI